MSYKLAQFSSAIGTDHSNTTTEGSVARKAFAVGELLPGKVYGFSCGVITSASDSSDTLALRVRFGSSSTVTSNTAIYTGGAVDQVDADLSWIRGELHVQSATRLVMCVAGSDPDAVGSISAKDAVVVVTTAAETAYYLDVTADWSVAATANKCAAACFAVWEIA